MEPQSFLRPADAWNDFVLSFGRAIGALWLVQRVAKTTEALMHWRKHTNGRVHSD